MRVAASMRKRFEQNAPKLGGLTVRSGRPSPTLQARRAFIRRRWQSLENRTYRLWFACLDRLEDRAPDRTTKAWDRSAGSGCCSLTERGPSLLADMQPIAEATQGRSVEGVNLWKIAIRLFRDAQSLMKYEV